MALETWDDIGSTLEQAEKNIYGSPIPSDQGFPLNGGWQIFENNFEEQAGSAYTDFITRTNTKLSDSNSFGAGIKSTLNSFRTGGFSMLYKTSRYGGSHRGDSQGTTFGISPSVFNYCVNRGMFSDASKAGAFILRVPYRSKVANSGTLFMYYLCMSHGADREDLGLTDIYQDIVNLYFNWNNYTYNGSKLWGSTYIRENSYNTLNNEGHIAFKSLLTDNAGNETTAFIKQNLLRLPKEMIANGLGGILTFYPDDRMYDRLYSEYDNGYMWTYGSMCGAWTSIDNYYNISGIEIYKSTLPIWDMSTDCVNDIITYLKTGIIKNAWYKTSDPFTPAVDTNITDTTTQWYVQSVYDTDPIYRINYKCADLGASTKDVRETWRGNIFVDSVWSMDNTTKLVQLTKSQCVLYDRPYTSHTAGISVKWKRIWELVAKAGVNVGESSSAWFQQNNTYTFHIGMCIYTADQISNIVYFTAKYNTTSGLTWGTITDNGDDSEVIFSIVSTSAVEDAGGISNIQRPDADDGYTGVDTSSEEEDYTYNPEGDGDVPTDTITPTSDNGVSVGGKFCTTYQVTTAQLKAISTYFWDDGNNGFMSKYINAVNNPIESILSVGYMPVSVTSGVGSDSIFIGNVNLTAQAPDCLGYTVGDTTRKVVIGELDIPEVYSSFLDYQPYTNLTIFLPYIGFKTLPPNMFMGKKLKVEYAFDLITGACKALLSANGKYIMSFDSDCMIKIPLTASNNSDVFMQRLRSAVEAGVSIMSAGVGSVAITSGGTKTTGGERFSRSPSAAGKGYAMKRTSQWSETTTKEPTEYHSHNYGGVVSQVVGAGLDIAMAKHTYETYGGASSAVASVEPNSVYVIIDSPTVQYPSTYNHNCGKPCELSKYLSSLTGYTEVDGGIDLNGIPCTDTEREEIHSLLVSGVYL